MIQESTALNKIHSIATLMRERGENKEPPYVLLLGAGASLASGASSMTQIIDTVVQEHAGQDPVSLSEEKKLTVFYEKLDQVSAEERYLILSRHLKGAELSAGYRHLTALIKAGYFNMILNTNFDLFLENALMDAGMRSQDFTVLINGQDQEEQIIASLKYVAPRVKLLKLHGDLNARLFAFTPAEIFQFAGKIEHALTEILNQDLLVVGHSLRDDDINRCLRANGGALWYVNPNEPAATDFVGRAIHSRGTPEHFIHGELGRFDAFFAWLRLELILPAMSLTKLPDERRSIAELNNQRLRHDLPGMAATLEALGKFYAAALEKEKERTEMCFDRSAALFERLADRRSAARVWRTLGTFHAQLSRPEKALHCYRHSRDLSREANDLPGEAQALAMIGQWWRAAHELEKAISYWEDALKISGGLSDSERERVSRWLNETRQELKF